MNKSIYIILFIWIFHTACGRAPINIQSVNLFPYREEEVGKFIRVCLSRHLKENEEIQVRAIFKTKTAKIFDRTFVIYGPSGLDKKTKCKTTNLYLTLDRLSRLAGRLKSSEVRARDILRNHVVAGNILSLEVRLGDNLNQANQKILDQKMLFDL